MRIPRTGAEEPDKLPPREDVAKQLRLRNEDRERNRLRNIAPIDKTKAELAELRKQRQRDRMRLVRRNAGVEGRANYLARVKLNEPWKALGISKATYYRRKAKAETGFVATPRAPNETGPCVPQGP